MSRSNYDDCCDGWELIRWRGAVASAIRGKRGQQMLRELADALDAMPEKRLIKGSLVEDGQVCALGCLGKAKGIEMANLDPWDSDGIAKAFNIADALAREVFHVNDEWQSQQNPEQRWVKMRQWVAEQLHGIRTQP